MKTDIRELTEELSEIPESDIVSRVAMASDLAKNPEVRKEITKYGKVPVVYLQSRSVWKDRHRQDPGISAFIEEAMTVQDVNEILTQSKLNYKYAQPKIIKKWESAAKKRIEELSK